MDKQDTPTETEAYFSSLDKGRHTELIREHAARLIAKVQEQAEEIAELKQQLDHQRVESGVIIAALKAKLEDVTPKCTCDKCTGRNIESMYEDD